MALSSRSIQLLNISLLLSILHHTDHVLRIDHSGWPFIQSLSPFTYSLLVYPVFASVYFVHKRWYRVTATGFLFLTATAAHIFFEPLRDKYHTWTYRSDLPGHVNEQNLIGYNSPVLGVLSITLAVALSLVLLLTLLAFIKEARQFAAK